MLNYWLITRLLSFCKTGFWINSLSRATSSSSTGITIPFSRLTAPMERRRFQLSFTLTIEKKKSFSYRILQSMRERGSSKSCRTSPTGTVRSASIRRRRGGRRWRGKWSSGRCRDLPMLTDLVVLNASRWAAAAIVCVKHIRCDPVFKKIIKYFCRMDYA